MKCSADERMTMDGQWLETRKKRWAGEDFPNEMTRRRTPPNGVARVSPALQARLDLSRATPKTKRRDRRPNLTRCLLVPISICAVLLTGCITELGDLSSTIDGDDVEAAGTLAAQHGVTSADGQWIELCQAISGPDPANAECALNLDSVCRPFSFEQAPCDLIDEWQSHQATCGQTGLPTELLAFVSEAETGDVVASNGELGEYSVNSHSPERLAIQISFLDSDLTYEFESRSDGMIASVTGIFVDPLTEEVRPVSVQTPLTASVEDGLLSLARLEDGNPVGIPMQVWTDPESGARFMEFFGSNDLQFLQSY
jgi:hypothetical protein